MRTTLDNSQLTQTTGDLSYRANQAVHQIRSSKYRMGYPQNVDGRSRRPIITVDSPPTHSPGVATEIPQRRSACGDRPDTPIAAVDVPTHAGPLAVSAVERQIERADLGRYDTRVGEIRTPVNRTILRVHEHHVGLVSLGLGVRNGGVADQDD